jgi:predicted permease
MFVGFFLRKRNYIDERVTKGLSTILVSVGMPLMIVHGLQLPYSPERIHDLGTMMGGYVICSLAGMLPCMLYCFLRRKSLRETGAWLNCAAFSNAIFMGRPVAIAVWGEEVFFPLTGVMFCYNILTFTLGVFLFNMGGEEKLSLKKQLLLTFKNPALPCGAIGFIFFVTSVKLPAPVFQAVDMLVNITTPLAMIIIGSQLARFPLRSVFLDGRVYLLSACKLLVAPVLTVLVLSPFIQSPLLMGLLLLSATMPTGTSMSVFAERYDNNPELASRTVFVSTLLSIVTVPLMVGLLI